MVHSASISAVPPPRAATSRVSSRWPAGRLRGWLLAIDRAWEWMLGVVSLIVLLAIVATLPVLQLLSLGYLLEAGGRVARQRRLAAGLFGIRTAARIGSVALGAWLLLWIPRLVSSIYYSAWLIDPESRAARGWWFALVAVTAWVLVHVVAACYRGGRLRHFLWPRPLRMLRAVCSGSPAGTYRTCRDVLWNFVTQLRLPYLFWLGLRGCLGGLLWLAIPTTMLVLGQQVPLVGVLGGILLAAVVVYLPFLQIQMAAKNRFTSIFDLAAARRAAARAPAAQFLALFVTLALALPLYLLQVELIPREAAWLPGVLFILSVFPARLLCGWALAQSQRADQPCHLCWRSVWRMLSWFVATVYVGLLYFTPYIAWYGVWGLYAQHAFLVPAPLIGP